METVTKNSNLEDEYSKVKKLYEMASAENEEKDYKERRMQSEFKDLKNKYDLVEKERNKIKEEFKTLEQ